MELAKQVHKVNKKTYDYLETRLPLKRLGIFIWLTFLSSWNVPMFTDGTSDVRIRIFMVFIWAVIWTLALYKIDKIEIL